VRVARALERIVRPSARRPARVIAGVAALAAVCAAFALTLDPSAATDTLVNRSSDSYAATERYRERFGEQSVIVLVRGDVSNLVLTKNLNALVGLEGCLSGNKPADAPSPGGERSACAALSRTKPVQVVYGPGTFVNSAVGEIQQQLALRSQQTQAQAKKAGRAARKVAAGQGRSKAAQDKAAKAAEQVVYAGLLKELLQINLKYGLGLTGVPQINDPNFVSALVFDPSRGAGTPKARFAYLFPNRNASIIQVRLKESLTDAQRRDAITQIRRAVQMPEWKLDKASYTVTGAPVVLEDLADALAGSVLRLLVVALIVMALVLALVFRSRLRIVPLAVALAAVAVTFGAMALIGAPLTMASIAVLPVLLGLGVDYAIQFQARVEEEGGDAERAVRVAGPTIATAALATGVGFLVLQLSPVPMVRGFGALLVAGIVFALLLAFSAGTAALALSLRRERDGVLARSLRGAGELADSARAALAGPAGRVGAAGTAVLRAVAAAATCPSAG
jgi:predicted RND superfamily exporter protein